MTARRTTANRVRRAFNAPALERICMLDDFGEYATRYDLPAGADGRERFYYYRDNGAEVLAVAHLDTVQQDRRCTVVETSAGLVALSGALDDRLGAYVILDLLPRLGVECDILLTTDEEIGASTAEDFAEDWSNEGAPKEYRWLFSFDRGGTDVVLYDYEDEETAELVRASRAVVGSGIWSDICSLESLGVKGLNWGVGYRDYHSPRGHAWLEDTFRMVGSFVRFYRANASRTLPHYPAWSDLDRDDRDDRDDEWRAWLDDLQAKRA